MDLNNGTAAPPEDGGAGAAAPPEDGGAGALTVNELASTVVTLSELSSINCAGALDVAPPMLHLVHQRLGHGLELKALRLVPLGARVALVY